MNNKQFDEKKAELITMALYSPKDDIKQKALKELMDLMYQKGVTDGKWFSSSAD